MIMIRNVDSRESNGFGDDLGFKEPLLECSFTRFPPENER